MDIINEKYEKHDEKNKDRIQSLIQKTEAAYLFCDIERTAGALDSEILQIAIVCPGRKAFNCFIKPRGGIDQGASKYSHKMTLDRIGNVCDAMGRTVQTVSTSECIQDMFSYIREIRSFTETELTMVVYGDSDVPNLSNTLDSLGKFEEFKNLVPFYCDFQQVLFKDEDLKKKTNGKTGLADTSHNSILKVVTGRLVDLHQAHDAMYDCKKLEDLFFKYLKSGYYCETMSSFRSNAVKTFCDGEEDIRRVLVRMRKKRINKPNPFNIFYPLGFSSTSSSF